MAPMLVTARASWRHSSSSVNLPCSCAVAQATRVLADSRAPPRFVTRPRPQSPRSAAAPYPRPRNAGRSGSCANTACESRLAGSMPSSPRRRERLRDRSKQPQGSCRADQANFVRWYTAAKAATMPLSRGASFRYKSPAAGGGTRSRHRACWRPPRDALPTSQRSECCMPAPAKNRPHRSPSRAQKCRRNALTKCSILGLKSEGSRTM